MDSKPWYQSKGVLGGIASGIAALAILLKVFGVDIADIAPVLTTQALAAVGLVGSVVAIIGRIKAWKNPLITAGKDSGPVLGIVIAFAFVSFSLTSCADAPTRTGVANSPATSAGLDVATLAAQATQAYVQYKAGNVDYAWAVAQGLTAYQTIMKTAADVKSVVAMFGGDATLAQKLANLFADSNAPPTARTAAIVRAVQTTAATASGGGGGNVGFHFKHESARP